MSAPSIDTFIFCSGIIAAVIAVLLIASQNDRVARNILSPLRLRAKRRQEQLYKLEKAIAKSILYIRRYINNGNFYDWDEEKKITDLILHDEAIQDLVKEIVVSCNEEQKTEIEDKSDDTGVKTQQTRKTPLIVGISKDLTLPKADEWYIHLAFPIIPSSIDKEGIDDYTKIQYGRRVQVPLLNFGRLLASEFQKQTSYPKICFIADASSSLGSKIIGEMIEYSKFDVPLIQEPAWMFTLAFLIQSKVYKMESMENILFALCRLSAQAVSHKVGTKYNTIAITLPGQASTASLLLYMQHVFPNARYLLLQDDCVRSILRSKQLCKKNAGEYENSRKMNGKNSSLKRIIPETVMPRDISSSVPIQLLNIKQLERNMAYLNGNLASIFEAWMSSVKTFKLMENRTNFHCRPYVCELEKLLDNENHHNSLIALENLLNFILGHAGNSEAPSIGEHDLDAAASIIAETRDNSFLMDSGTNITDEQHGIISQCKSDVLRTISLN